MKKHENLEVSRKTRKLRKVRKNLVVKKHEESVRFAHFSEFFRVSSFSNYPFYNPEGERAAEGGVYASYYNN